MSKKLKYPETEDELLDMLFIAPGDKCGSEQLNEGVKLLKSFGFTVRDIVDMNQGQREEQLREGLRRAGRTLPNTESVFSRGYRVPDSWVPAAARHRPRPEDAIEVEALQIAELAIRDRGIVKLEFTDGIITASTKEGLWTAGRDLAEVLAHHDQVRAGLTEERKAPA